MEKLYINKETGEVETFQEIKKEFDEIKGNTNEFNSYDIEKYLLEYYSIKNGK